MKSLFHFKSNLLSFFRFVCHQVVHNGKQGVALVFDRRHHSDMRKLYHKLNQLLSTNKLLKVTDCVQILNRARDEILRLEKLDEEFNAQRKELTKRRNELFKNFSSKLKYLPSSHHKKVAVTTLKEGLKKKVVSWFLSIFVKCHFHLSILKKIAIQGLEYRI